MIELVTTAAVCGVVGKASCSCLAKPSIESMEKDTEESEVDVSLFGDELGLML